MLNIMLIITAIMPQFVWSFIIFNDYISIVRLQPVILHNAMLQCSNIQPIIMFYQVSMVTVSQKFY